MLLHKTAALRFLTFLGRLFYCHISLHRLALSFDSRVDFGWSSDWNRILSQAKLDKTARSTGMFKECNVRPMACNDDFVEANVCY